MMKNLARALIRSGAKLPRQWKGGLTEKVFFRIIRWYREKYKEGGLLVTDLGMPGKLRITLPLLEAPPMFFFGTPASYTGEFYTVNLASALARYSAAFVDVGANWGFFTYFVKAANPDIPVYWFEPNPGLFQSIDANTKANGFSHTFASQQAISDSEGQLSFYAESGDGFNSSLVKPDGVPNIREITVEVIRFDRWVTANHLPGKLLVKVDVENAEWNFIKGVGEQFPRIEYLIMEVLGPARQSGFVDHLAREANMRAYYINGPRIEHVQKEDMRYTKGEYNWLFCRHSPEALRQQLEGSFFTVIE